MNSPLLINMDIESVWIMIHGLHVTWLQYPVRFRQILLCKRLANC